MAFVLEDAPQSRFVLEDAEPVAPISKGDKFMRGLKDPLDAGAQLLTHILPKSVVDAGNKFNNYVADKTGLFVRLPEGGMDELVKQQEADYQSQRAASGETGIDGYRLAGNVLSPANLAIASKLPMAGTLAQRTVQGALGGAGMTAATQPVYGDNFAQEKLKQAATGAIGGAVLPSVTGAVSRFVSPKASLNPNVAKLKAEGVTPTIGQTLGGRAASLEEKAQSLPILGDMISRARNNANSQFESAVYNRALAPIGVELPKGLAGREAVSFAESAIKSKYDDVLNSIGAVQVDDAFNANVGKIDQMVKGLMIPKAEKMKFQSALNDVKQSINKDGYLTSEGYKMLESSLGSDAKKLGISTNIYDSKLSPAVKQLQSELRELLNRQAGSKADELQNANAAWAQFKRIQKAASSLGAEGGSFTPAQFQSAVKSAERSNSKFAKGNALMQDLGDAGKSVLTGKVPNSGTADRLMLGGGALGSYMLNPAIPASLIGGGAMYTQPMQKLLGGLLTNRPDFAPTIANAIKQSTPYLLPSVGLLD